MLILSVNMTAVLAKIDADAPHVFHDGLLQKRKHPISSGTDRVQADHLIHRPVVQDGGPLKGAFSAAF